MTQTLEDAQSLYSVEADLTFAIRDGATPVSLSSKPGEAEGRYEGDHETRRVEITNAWPLADELSVDCEGFRLAPHHTDADFYDDAAWMTNYEEQIQELIKQAPGGSLYSITRCGPMMKAREPSGPCASPCRWSITIVPTGRRVSGCAIWSATKRRKS